MSAYCTEHLLDYPDEYLFIFYSSLNCIALYF